VNDNLSPNAAAAAAVSVAIPVVEQEADDNKDDTEQLVRDFLAGIQMQCYANKIMYVFELNHTSKSSARAICCRE